MRPGGALLRAAGAIACSVLVVWASGCRRSPTGASGHGRAPLEPFVKADLKNRKGEPVSLPETASHPWRVLVLQVEPRPIKNPKWSTIASEASARLEMPDRSTFECVHGPIKVEAVWDETMMHVDEWRVLRRVQCSNDGWITHTGTGLSLSYDRDGKLQSRSADQAELQLDEVIRGRPTQISVLLRPD